MTAPQPPDPLEARAASELGAAGAPILGAADLAIADAVLTSIAEEMGEALGRTAYSPNIKERRDFSCGVFDAEGQMVAQAAHMPVHLGAMPAAVRAVMELAPFASGDVLAVNDPFRGGTHLPDLTTVSPVFVADRLIGFVATRAHHADIGGMAPGSMPVARELLQEGLVVPPIRLVDAGRPNDSAIALIVRNSRAPDERRGDLRAQLAATALGARRLQAAAERFSVPGLLHRFAALLDHGERVVRAVITQIPDGRYPFEDRMEVGPDGIAIRVTLEVTGDEVHFDFTGTDPETDEASVNAVATVTRSACYYAIRCLAGPDAPRNEGCYRPIRFTLPERSLVAAGPPRAVSAGNVETSQRITDVALGALALALPDRIPAASSGTMNNITIGGYDTARARPYAYYETIAGGAGGGPRRPGRSGVHTHMTNTMNTPIEALPLAYPFTVERYALRPHTGGDGQHPGGDGLLREYRFHDHATVSIVSERRRFHPWGLHGGQPGALGRNTLIRADATTTDLGPRAEVDVHPGDRIRIETPGGGGWGRSSTSDD
jgi:N-methylhydantoinase B